MCRQTLLFIVIANCAIGMHVHCSVFTNGNVQMFHLFGAFLHINVRIWFSDMVRVSSMVGLLLGLALVLSFLTLSLSAHCPVWLM